MTDFKIANADGKVFKHGAPAAEKFEQGTPVGMDASGNYVVADADSGVAIPAVGVAMAPVRDLADYAGMPESVRVTVEQNYVLINGNRVAAFTRGIELENNDEDSGFTPGQPVYLAEGGGYTQTAPSGSGDLVQTLGVALTPERIALDVSYDIQTV
jgi:hypothetical protein